MKNHYVHNFREGSSGPAQIYGSLREGIRCLEVLDTPARIVRYLKDSGPINDIGKPFLDIWIIPDLKILKSLLDLVSIRHGYDLKSLLLTHYYGSRIDPDQQKKGAYGKPYCERGIFDFNLSHTSAGWHAFAITNTGLIGVDIEPYERVISLELQRWLIPYIVFPGSRIQRMQKEHLPLLAWTMNEAFVKATGWGLRNRNIGWVAMSESNENVSGCGRYRFHHMEKRRWRFITIKRDPVMVTLAIKQRQASKPLECNEHVLWCE